MPHRLLAGKLFHPRAVLIQKRHRAGCMFRHILQPPGHCLLKELIMVVHTAGRPAQHPLTCGQFGWFRVVLLGPGQGKHQRHSPRPNQGRICPPLDHIQPPWLGHQPFLTRHCCDIRDRPAVNIRRPCLDQHPGVLIRSKPRLRQQFRRRQPFTKTLMSGLATPKYRQSTL